MKLINSLSNLQQNDTAGNDPHDNWNLHHAKQMYVLLLITDQYNVNDRLYKVAGKGMS